MSIRYFASASRRGVLRVDDDGPQRLDDDGGWVADDLASALFVRVVGKGDPNWDAISDDEATKLSAKRT